MCTKVTCNKVRSKKKRYHFFFTQRMEYSERLKGKERKGLGYNLC